MRLLLASVAALVLLMIEGSLAINFSLDPDPDSTIESVIQCPGDPLFVPLNGNFTPISSGFKFPGGLPSIGTMLNLLNMIGSDFNINSQQIGPSVPSLAFSANRPPICPSIDEIQAIQSDLPFLQYSRRIEQRFAALNISEQLSSDFYSRLDDLVEILDCKPGSVWIDAGQTYFPRIMLTGMCVQRLCSIPDRSNFLCRPDLTNRDEMGVIHAFRWDCCPNRMCGWRRVLVPIICDCDCACGAEM